MEPQTGWGRHLRRFGPFVRPCRPRIVVAIGSTVLAVAADTGAVWLFSDIIDRIASGGGLPEFWLPALCWVVLAVTGAAATFGSTYLGATVAEDVLLRLRDGTYAHLQRLGPAFYTRHPVGDLTQRLSADIEEIEELLASGVIRAVSAVVSVVFFTVAAFLIQWQLALAVLLSSPLLVLLVRRFSRGIGETAAQERAGNGEIGDTVHESLARIALVQAYRTETQEAARVHDAGSNWRLARLVQARMLAVYTPLSTLFETLGVIIVLGVGAWAIAAGSLTIGGLVGFATFIGFLYEPVTDLAGLVVSVSAAGAAADRVAEVLDTGPEVADLPAGVAEPPRRGVVELRDVHVAHPDAAVLALRGIDLTLTPGTLTLVTGPSGSGKSTLARLFPRFTDPGRGVVLIDGVDVREFRLHALRAAVTLLPQGPALVDGSVIDNIVYGSAGEDPGRVVAAARAAGADRFVRELPQGYRTRLGPRGNGLSGGQQQRVALARAFYRDTPILVLDEPTTGLDAAAVAELAPVLRRLARDRTLVVISHEPALEPIADRVLVLDHGRITERGVTAAVVAG